MNEFNIIIAGLGLFCFGCSIGYRYGSIRMHKDMFPKTVTMKATENPTKDPELERLRNGWETAFYNGHPTMEKIFREMFEKRLKQVEEEQKQRQTVGGCNKERQ